MGIRFSCPNGHQLHVKSELGGKRGICPQCGAKVLIPAEEPAPEASMMIPLAAVEGAQKEGDVPRGVAPPPDGERSQAGGGAVHADAGSSAPDAGDSRALGSGSEEIYPPAVTSGPPAAEPPVVIPGFATPVAPTAPNPASLYHQRRARQERTRKLIIGVLLALTLVFVAALVWQLTRGRG